MISTRPGLNRYLRVTPGGLLRVDAAKIKTEENLDGKYLLRTSDPKLPAEDIALGYKQLPRASSVRERQAKATRVRFPKPGAPSHRLPAPRRGLGPADENCLLGATAAALLPLADVARPFTEPRTGSFGTVEVGARCPGWHTRTPRLPAIRSAAQLVVVILRCEIFMVPGLTDGRLLVAASRVPAGTGNLVRSRNRRASRPVHSRSSRTGSGPARYSQRGWGSSRAGSMGRCRTSRRDRTARDGARSQTPRTTGPRCLMRYAQSAGRLSRVADHQIAPRCQAADRGVGMATYTALPQRAPCRAIPRVPPYVCINASISWSPRPRSSSSPGALRTGI